MRSPGSFKKQAISSAYAKSLTWFDVGSTGDMSIGHTGVKGKEMPVMRLSFKIDRSSGSKARLKSTGESGSPCRNPLRCKKGDERWPLTFT